MSEWIDHVKAYAKKHGVSYKEAMSKAKASYKPKHSKRGGVPLSKEQQEKKEKKIKEKKMKQMEKMK